MTILAHDYWCARRREYGMPAWSDLNPSVMRKFMAHVGLIEVRPPRDRPAYFIRQAGTRWE